MFFSCLVLGFFLPAPDRGERWGCCSQPGAIVLLLLPHCSHHGRRGNKNQMAIGSFATALAVTPGKKEKSTSGFQCREKMYHIGIVFYESPQFCFLASGLEAVGCPEPYHVFGTGWRKVLGFFASASHTQSLNYPVMLSSCIQNKN